MKQIIHLFTNQIIQEKLTLNQDIQLNRCLLKIAKSALKAKQQVFIVGVNHNHELTLSVFNEENESITFIPYEFAQLSKKELIKSSLLVTDGILILDKLQHAELLSWIEFSKKIEKPIFLIKDNKDQLTTTITKVDVDRNQEKAWLIHQSADITYLNKDMLIPSFQGLAKPECFEILFAYQLCVSKVFDDEVAASVLAAKLAHLG